MSGDILIIDSIATNRIVLKVKLLAAQYRVRPCASLEDAKTEISASAPDMIIVDTASETEAALDFCRGLKAADETNLIPIIATGGFATPRERVTALEAGADDVLTKPFDDHILQARLRSLLRARDARLELRMRDGTRSALGFAEANTGFTTVAAVVIATENGRPPDDLAALENMLHNCNITCTDTAHLTFDQGATASSDLIMLDFRSGLQDDKELFRLLSDLRSRSSTRHAAIFAILPLAERQAAAMALDLGVNDIVSNSALPEEIAHRANVLIQSKREADTLRRTVESGLEAAITDPLTGLFNRRYALPHLSRLSDESNRTGRQFAVMVLDLDHFKSINDTHGHAAGDEVLRQVAERLKGNLRAVDLLARIGGEEFLVAIPNSDVVHARTAAERLCKLVGDTPFFVGPDRTELRITMSVGVSLNGAQPLTPDEKEDLSNLVNAADVALYEAKSCGRNQVILSAA